MGATALRFRPLLLLWMFASCSPTPAQAVLSSRDSPFEDCKTTRFTISNNRVYRGGDVFKYVKLKRGQGFTDCLALCRVLEECWTFNYDKSKKFCYLMVNEGEELCRRRGKTWSSGARFCTPHSDDSAWNNDAFDSQSFKPQITFSSSPNLNSLFIRFTASDTGSSQLASYKLKCVEQEDSCCSGSKGVYTSDKLTSDGNIYVTSPKIPESTELSCCITLYMAGLSASCSSPVTVLTAGSAVPSPPSAPTRQSGDIVVGRYGSNKLGACYLTGSIADGTGTYTCVSSAESTFSNLIGTGIGMFGSQVIAYGIVPTNDGQHTDVFYCPLTVSTTISFQSCVTTDMINTGLANSFVVRGAVALIGQSDGVLNGKLFSDDGTYFPSSFAYSTGYTFVDSDIIDESTWYAVDDSGIVYQCWSQDHCSSITLEWNGNSWPAQYMSALPTLAYFQGTGSFSQNIIVCDVENSGGTRSFTNCAMVATVPPLFPGTIQKLYATPGYLYVSLKNGFIVNELTSDGRQSVNAMYYSPNSGGYAPITGLASALYVA